MNPESSVRPTAVLITGSAGRLGRAASRALQAAGIPVHGYDRLPTPKLQRAYVGSIQDLASLRRAAQGCGALLHLAATPDDSDAEDWFETELIPSNIVGVRTVLEAARLEGIRRIVLASSGQINWRQQYQGPLPVRANDPITPRFWYAASKAFLESAGYSYADKFGMTVIAVRLGWCPRKGQSPEIAQSTVAQDLYLSPHDAGRFFERAVNAPIPSGFHILYATSMPIREPILDLESAKTLLGWQPKDRWPAGAEDDGN